MSGGRAGGGGVMIFRRPILFSALARRDRELDALPGTFLEGSSTRQTERDNRVARIRVTRRSYAERTIGRTDRVGCLDTLKVLG